MKVSVKVPATTANLGPGFDCLGMALPIYNVITIEETVIPNSGVEINIFSENQDYETASIPTDNDSIAYKALEMLYNSIGQTPGELKISISTDIPVARGLGSSASVIVGTLLAANKLLGSPADEAALLSIATEVEGHPDNVAPAILGGLVLVSQEDDDSIVYSRLAWPKEWSLVMCIPDYELATNISRSVIPENVPLKDAKFNLRRLGMFVQAVNTKDENLMKNAMLDKLHQPYRDKFIPGFSEIREALKYEQNVLGCVLSGAGPSILVVANDNKIDNIRQKVLDIWSRLNISASVLNLSIEEQGAYIIEK